jgi:predicted phosphodiesterase
MPKKVSDEVFIATWKKLQNTPDVSKELGLEIRNIHRRRKRIEERYGIQLNSNSPTSPTFYRREHLARTDCTLENGTIVVCSDAHYWPGVVSIAHQAMLKVIQLVKPQMVVLNGDMFDGSSISRYPKSSWGTTPTVKQELDAVSERLDEIKQAAGTAKRWWCLGNHDMRFEAKLANLVPEFEGVPGFSLQEQFSDWPMSISLFVNQNLMIKHRFRNGVHATWNNPLHSGCSIVTGHLHRLQASILTDYNGTRWGVDTGTLGFTSGEHMSYGEDNPANHCSGFAVLTVVNGKLIQPEFCAVQNDRAFFRGKEV